MRDLVLSLRDYAKDLQDPTSEALMVRAAAEIERLRAFVSVADELQDSIRMGTEGKRKVMAVCDYDIARAALAQEKPNADSK